MKLIEYNMQNNFKLILMIIIKICIYETTYYKKELR